MQDKAMTLDQALSQRHTKPLSQYQWWVLIKDLEPSDTLLKLLAINDPSLQQAVLEKYKKQKYENWQMLYDFAAHNPESICRAAPRHTDIPLWRIVWRSNIDECQQWVISTLCQKLGWLKAKDNDGPLLADYFAELAETHAAQLLAHLNERYLEGWTSFYPHGVMLLWRLHLPDFDPIMLALLATTENAYRQEQTIALVHEIINADPDYLLNVKPAKLALLLASLDESSLHKAAAQLLKTTSKSATQSLRDALTKLFGRFNPDLLQKLGWLNKKTKNVRLACLDILIQHPDKRACSYLRNLYQTGNLDQNSKDRVLSHLEASGENIDDLDELANLSLAELAEQAATLKKVSKTVENIYYDELAALLPTLEPVLVRWLLHQLASDSEERIPRSVHKILQQCPQEQRQHFVAALVQQWLAHNGEPKLRWLLQLIPYGADDRLVPSLMEAVQTWHKKQKQRAAHAIHALAYIDTVFALSQIKVISETRNYTDLLVDTAQNELRAAAQRRKQPLTDLLDELVPDFGLADGGLELDVGPYSYRLQLQGDLSLRVIRPDGKSNKSLPKAKPEEDTAKRADAEATFKRIRKAIKTISEQQAKRMQTALLSARRWPAARWRRLFVEHPLLRSLAQSLIWSQHGIDGSDSGSFRLVEDLSLIDYQDEVIEPHEDALITLWHPIQASSEAGDCRMASALGRLCDYSPT